MIMLPPWTERYNRTPRVLYWTHGRPSSLSSPLDQRRDQTPRRIQRQSATSRHEHQRLRQKSHRTRIARQRQNQTTSEPRTHAREVAAQA